MKRFYLLILIFIPLLLYGCLFRKLTADTFPWVGDAPILFKDDFSYESGGWTTHEDPISFSGYSQGGFRLWVNVPDYQFWSVPGLNFKDTLIYSRVRKLGGPDDNIIGLLCRYQNKSNYYAFVISSDGYYGIYKMLDGEQSLINQEHLDFNPTINQGNNVNEIQAVCVADQLMLFVNGIKLIEAQENTLLSGDVGLIVGNFSDAGVDVLFDDFIVVKP